MNLLNFAIFLASSDSGSMIIGFLIVFSSPGMKSYEKLMDLDLIQVTFYIIVEFGVSGSQVGDHS